MTIMPADGEADLESVADLLEDEDDEDTGHGQIMVSMTRAPRRDPPGPGLRLARWPPAATCGREAFTCAAHTVCR
jgi:hypothetical protein